MCGLSSCQFNRFEPALSDGHQDDIDATTCGVGHRLTYVIAGAMEVPDICPYSPVRRAREKQEKQEAGV